MLISITLVSVLKSVFNVTVQYYLHICRWHIIPAVHSYITSVAAKHPNSINLAQMPFAAETVFSIAHTSQLASGAKNGYPGDSLQLCSHLSWLYG